jgi:hypothetical protein
MASLAMGCLPEGELANLPILAPQTLFIFGRIGIDRDGAASLREWPLGSNDQTTLQSGYGQGAPEPDVTGAVGRGIAVTIRIAAIARVIIPIAAAADPS